MTAAWRKAALAAVRTQRRAAELAGLEEVRSGRRSVEEVFPSRIPWKNCELRWSDGRVEGPFAMPAAAMAVVKMRYPNAYFGGEGSIDQGGERTLFWQNEWVAVHSAGEPSLGEICLVRAEGVR